MWDLPVDGGLLWERLGAPRVDELRSRSVPDDSIGRDLAAACAGAIRSLRERHTCECSYVAGGLTQMPGFAHALAGLDPRVTVDPEGRFAGERGGLALLAEHGHVRGAVVDVGQTGIKAGAATRRRIVERDLAGLPLELIDPSGARPKAPAARATTAAVFVGDAIRALLDGSDVEALALALPCPLDDACVPGPCTYGWAGEASLVPTILERSGRPFREVLVMNDAELVAETALARGLRPPLLVLTLGFGPGAALVR